MMIKAGYWRTKKGGTACAHPMRERRARFGEMIQIVGSPHDWFEGRGVGLHACAARPYLSTVTDPDGLFSVYGQIA